MEHFKIQTLHPPPLSLLLLLYSYLITQAKHPKGIFAPSPTQSPLFPQQVNQQNFQCNSLQISLVLLFPLSFLPDLILQTWPITAPRLTHAKCLLEIIIKYKWGRFAPLLTQQSPAYWTMSKLIEMPCGALRTQPPLLLLPTWNASDPQPTCTGHSDRHNTLPCTSRPCLH